MAKTKGYKYSGHRFSSYKRAQDFSKKLEKSGYDTLIHRVGSPKNPWWVVYKKKETKKHRVQDASGGHDVKSRRKYRRGGRIEAYTMGEASGSKRWP